MLYLWWHRIAICNPCAISTRADSNVRNSCIITKTSQCFMNLHFSCLFENASVGWWLRVWAQKGVSTRDLYFFHLLRVVVLKLMLARIKLQGNKTIANKAKLGKFYSKNVNLFAFTLLSLFKNKKVKMG